MAKKPITRAEVAAWVEKISDSVLADQDTGAETMKDRGAWDLLPSARPGRRKQTEMDKRDEKLRAKVKKALHRDDQYALLTLDSLSVSTDVLLVYPQAQLPGMGAPRSAGKGLVVVLEQSYLDGIFAVAREVWTISHILGTTEKGLERINGIGSKIGLHKDIASKFRDFQAMLDSEMISDERVKSMIRKSQKHYRQTNLEEKVEAAKARLGLVVNGN